MRASLKLKLTFFAGILVVLVAASVGLFVRWGEKMALLSGFETERADFVRALRQVTREAILVHDETGVVNFVNYLRESPTIRTAMVLFPDGRVRVHSDPHQIGQVLADPLSRAALAHTSRHTPLIQHATADGRPILDLSIPVVLGPDAADIRGVARIGFDKDAYDRRAAEVLRQFDSRILAALVVAVLVGLIGAFILGLVITRPIQVVRLGARRIGEGKLDHRITVRTRDELRDLADEFNLMAEKLSELDRMKRDFVSSVTHELRSPMTSIRGYIDLLLKEAAGPLAPLQADYLSVIKNSAVRLGRFIDNLLDVSKIEAHRLHLSPEELDVRVVAHEMEVLFKPQAEEKRIGFQNAVPETMSHAFVDKDKIAEVLINLTSNAIKFTPENGTIRFAATEKPAYIELRVEDTGPGIPPEMLGRVFDKFEQVKAKRGDVKAQKGTGLGLSIARGVVEAHGGKIWAESPVADGKGTAFVFTVPKLTDDLRARLAGKG